MFFLPILGWKHAENANSFLPSIDDAKIPLLLDSFYDFWSTVPVEKWSGHRFPPSLAKGMTFFLRNIYEQLQNLDRAGKNNLKFKTKYIKNYHLKTWRSSKTFEKKGVFVGRGVFQTDFPFWSFWRKGYS